MKNRRDDGAPVRPQQETKDVQGGAAPHPSKKRKASKSSGNLDTKRLLDPRSELGDEFQTVPVASGSDGRKSREVPPSSTSDRPDRLASPG